MRLRVVGNGDGSVGMATGLRNRKFGNHISVGAGDFSIVQKIETTLA